MGSWTTAVQELRTLISDTPSDRYCYRKKVFGDINGVNVSFKTFEFRRVTNFTDPTLSAAPLGIYLGGTRLTLDQIASDDILSGEFSLKTAPSDTGIALTATYYFQWFNDDELTSFLVGASRWLQIGDDFTNVPGGLTQAALYYAAKDALRKMAMRWATRASNTFLLEDAPKKESMEIAATYSTMGAAFEKSGDKYRDDYYTKSGQSLEVSFASNWGSVGNVTPRR
jgi:hypothetical protein